ncbi:myosin-11 [Exaiptasia diaphana]|uniref:Uncharacterized protein n=1 Tax=Exaiptasia diaphana TaxID=2652724 RepID=A0A913WYI8_EXADI|nr:myosin-11 [Exaiptasia diaphana]KXJ27621.1 hypothetical protein AC249_AIPGENE7577 [Exaiptasia diaphana]
MAVNESLRALEYMEEKENFPSEVSQLFTPGRKPLKAVQENLVGTPELTRSTKSRIARSSFTPAGLNPNKTKRKSKRLSIPVHVFRRSLKQTKQLHSPLLFPSNLKPKAVQIDSDKSGSKYQVTKRRSVLPHPKSVIPKDNETDYKLPVHNDEISEETRLDCYAEGFVKDILRDIQMEYQSNQKNKDTRNLESDKLQQTSEQSEQETDASQNNEVYQKKIQEYTEIILQMNKERLQLEKQLSLYRKEIERPATTHPLTKVSQTTSQKSKTTSTNHPTLLKESSLQKELFKKTSEVQKLQKELQQVKSNKSSLESKKEEIRQLKVEINQLHHQVRGVPGLKSELQKSRQQVINLNEVILTCRQENKSQKSLVTKLEKEVNSKEARTKQCMKECEHLKNDLSEREKSISELQELVLSSEEENRYYKLQCENLSPLVDRLEFVSEKAEKFKATAQQKILHLTHDLDEKTHLIKDTEDQLQSSRSEAAILGEYCAKLKHQISELTSEVDVGRLEISRQKGVIKSLEEELEKLKTENNMYQEHLELIQCQNLEMNNFLEEEKRTLEETAREMEKELVTTKQRGEKVEQLEEEVKFSRSLVMEKQEELDATQSQAHCIIQQLQNEISDGQEALAELWDILGPLLKRFRENVHRDFEDKEKQIHQGTIASTTSGVSLVQSVLSAAAQGQQTRLNDNSNDDDEDCITTLCSQINDLKQGLIELADIGYGERASNEARQRIKQLLQERESMERKHTAVLDGLYRELETSRSSETSNLCTIQKQKTEINNLVITLNSTRENLKQVNKENDSLNGLLELEFEQRRQISDLKDELQRKEVEYKRLVSEKDCIQEQLTEAINRVGELSTAGTHDSGKLLEEKFMAERKLKQVKDRWMEYRLKADDRLNENKLTTSRKIMNFEKSLKKAEGEIVRLDQALEKIRNVLRRNLPVVNECPSLSKVLRFLDGEESEYTCFL